VDRLKPSEQAFLPAAQRRTPQLATLTTTSRTTSLRTWPQRRLFLNRAGSGLSREGKRPSNLGLVRLPKFLSDKPIYRGASTIAKAREVYGIHDPSEPQLLLFLETAKPRRIRGAASFRHPACAGSLIR